MKKRNNKDQTERIVFVAVFLLIGILFLIEAVFYLQLSFGANHLSHKVTARYQGGFTVEERSSWRNTWHLLHLDNGDAVAVFGDALNGSELAELGQKNVHIYYSSSRGFFRARFQHEIIAIQTSDQATVLLDPAEVNAQSLGLGIILICLGFAVWGIALIPLVFRLRMAGHRRRNKLRKT